MGSYYQLNKLDRTYKVTCFLCGYYGHGLNTCPNIQEFLEKCCRCWANYHESKDCFLSRKAIPFKRNFLNLSELLKCFGQFEES